MPPLARRTVPSIATARPYVAHGSIRVTRQRPQQPVCAGSVSSRTFNCRSQVRWVEKRPASVGRARTMCISAIGSWSTLSHSCTQSTSLTTVTRSEWCIIIEATSAVGVKGNFYGTEVAAFESSLSVAI
jgi:hypothetical protein